jgi:hypothetical protein
MTHTKQQVLELLQDPDYVGAAIILIGQNQTQDELRTKHTHNLNGEGFSAAYAKTGTRFYEFVTGIQVSTGKKKWQSRSLAHPKAEQIFNRRGTVGRFATVIEYARHIAAIHWRQLGAMFEVGFTVPSYDVQVGEAEAAPVKQEPARILLACQFIKVSGKAVQVKMNGNGKKVWLPKSLVQNTEDGLSIPTWLASNKGLL